MFVKRKKKLKKFESEELHILLLFLLICGQYGYSLSYPFTLFSALSHFNCLCSRPSKQK